MVLDIIFTVHKEQCQKSMNMVIEGRKCFI